MAKTDADCLRLLPDRRLGSFHRLRDLHHGCPCFRMGFEFPEILFGPRIANGGLLFRHDFHSSFRVIRVAIIAARVEAIRLKLSTYGGQADAFYASVEQRDDPTLKGKPVAVGYPAKRGVVTAASYAARRFGVRSAMPSTIAMRKCAELVFVSPRFDVYREVSDQIHAIFKDYTPLVEPLSLDDAYLDVTDNLKGIPTAWETAKEIRACIYDEIRLTASAGISCNKFLAKLASDHRKPNGQFAIMPDDAEAFVAILAVSKFHGAGPKTAVKMRALGIETGADLARQTLSFLQDHFGKSGSWYYDIARGRDEWSVQSRRDRRRLFQRT
jgi:DNA polymerase-4